MYSYHWFSAIGDSFSVYKSPVQGHLYNDIERSCADRNQGISQGNRTVRRPKSWWLYIQIASAGLVWERSWRRRGPGRRQQERLGGLRKGSVEGKNDSEKKHELEEKREREEDHWQTQLSFCGLFKFDNCNSQREEQLGDCRYNIVHGHQHITKGLDHKRSGGKVVVKWTPRDGLPVIIIAPHSSYISSSLAYRPTHSRRLGIAAHGEEDI